MMQSLIQILDLVGVAVFALSGALVASRKEMDLISFGLMATLTGIVGGAGGAGAVSVTRSSRYHRR